MTGSAARPDGFAAIFCTRGGAPDEVLEYARAPRRAVASGEIRIRVAAAGVNPADLLQITGAYHRPLPHPFTPGFEASGTVIETAHDVTEFEAGAPVLVSLIGGAYAEEVVAPAIHAIRIPSGLTDHALTRSDAAAVRAALEDVLGFIARGEVRPRPPRLVDLASAPAVLAALAAGERPGKTVLVPRTAN